MPLMYSPLVFSAEEDCVLSVSGGAQEPAQVHCGAQGSRVAGDLADHWRVGGGAPS